MQHADRQRPDEPFIHSSNDHSLLRIQPWLTYRWLVSGFTTRLNGKSSHPFKSFNIGLHVGDDPHDVVSNRRLLADRLNIPFERWTCGEQTHGTNIQYVGANEDGRGRETLKSALSDVDGLYTDRPGVLLTSFYADCVPLYLLDVKRRIIGLAHAGWKGTAGRIGPKMITLWQERFNSNLNDIRVAVGPAIGGCCYEVDVRVLKALSGGNKQEVSNDWDKGAVRPKHNGKYMLDLRKMNISFLQQAGIRTEHIECSSWCTSCHPHLFFSHRKEEGKTGRMASFVTIREGA
jgi:polyphenol oxidase